MHHIFYPEFLIESRIRILFPFSWSKCKMPRFLCDLRGNDQAMGPAGSKVAISEKVKGFSGPNKKKKKAKANADRLRVIIEEHDVTFLKKKKKKTRILVRDVGRLPSYKSNMNLTINL